jgi:ATP-dependent exoDNAse (exonuclease V) beta subunit
MPVSSQFQVYNASAGSGKTFTLVKEYLRILLSTKDSFRFQNILAITFTNKAAAEMKERVLKSLQDFSEGNENALLSILETEIKLPQDVLKIRAKLVLNSILQNYSAFNITTIDSFTHRLIRSFAFDLGLSMNFDVEMDSGALLDEAVDVLISKIGEDKDLTQVLIDYSLDKTDDDKSWDISNDLKDFANILLNENHVSNLRLIENKSIEDFSKLKKQLKKEIAATQKELTEIGKQGLEIIETTGLDPKDFYRSMLPNHFLNLAFDLPKAKFFDQSKLKDRIDEHNFYAKSKSDDIKATIESILPSLLELYSNAERCIKSFGIKKFNPSGRS